MVISSPENKGLVMILSSSKDRERGSSCDIFFRVLGCELCTSFSLRKAGELAHNQYA
jgi:hypothetical protein